VGDIKWAYKHHLIELFSVTEAPEPVVRKASDRGECWKYFSTSCISYLLQLGENEETWCICKAFQMSPLCFC
jgi:hypothetical protein